MAWQALDDETAPFFASDDLRPILAQVPAGWEAAVQFHRLKKVLADPRARERVRREAVAAVVHRARELLRHGALPHRAQVLPWVERVEGELDLDATLEEAAHPGNPEADELRVAVRDPRRADLVVILDMSLSMTGEKLALLATAVAVLALQVPASDLGVVAFDHRARVVKPLNHPASAEALVTRVLEVKAEGYTSIEAGLRRGLTALSRGTQPTRCALLITDGVYNVGFDPTPLAARFPRLHVVQVGADRQERGLCRRLAATGRGAHHQVADYEALPDLARRLVRDLFR